MNFKRLKMKAKKFIEWATPRRYQREVGLNHNPAKYPSWYCKKLKGKHNFVFQSSSGYSWAPDEITQNFRCSGCKKNKMKTIKFINSKVNNLNKKDQ